MIWKFTSWMKQNHSSFIFSEVYNIFFIFLQQEKGDHIYLWMFLRKQGYHVTNFARKTKVSSHKCGVKKVKLSRLLAYRINEFKMNEIQRETPQ